MYKPLLFTALTIAFVTSACTPPEEEASEELVRTVNVETRTVETEKFERFLKLVGTVQSQNDVQISSEVSGRIREYYVEQGEQVKRGEPILKIDDSQLLREKERLEAATEQSRENYERLKQLYEEENVGSEIDYLNARYTYEQNRASLESVKVSISKTTVEAPFDAVLEQKMLEEGEMANPGAVLVRLIGSNRLKVSTGVPSIYSDVIDKGDMTRIWFDFQKSDTLNLPISFVGQSIDPQTRTFEVEMRLPSVNRRYKVDMIANIMIRTQELDEAIVVGSEYIFQENGNNIVYTVAKNDQGNTIARSVPVKMGPAYRNDIVIEEGLKPGDTLITVGASFLQDNMRINIVDTRNSGIAQGNNK